MCVRTCLVWPTVSGLSTTVGCCCCCCPIRYQLEYILCFNISLSLFLRPSVRLFVVCARFYAVDFQRTAHTQKIVAIIVASTTPVAHVYETHTFHACQPASPAWPARRRVVDARVIIKTANLRRSIINGIRHACGAILCA